MQKSMLVAAFLLPLLVLIPVSAYAQLTYDVDPLNVPVGLAMSNDGGTMYVIETNNVYRYTLGTAFDITSITEAGINHEFPGSVGHSIQDVTVSNDGNTLYVLHNARGGEFVSVQVDPDGSIGNRLAPSSCCVTGGQGVAFSADGSWLFIGGGDTVRSYQLSTPFDITDSSVSALHGIFDTDLVTTHSVSISNDGTRLFVMDGVRVNQYALSPAYSLNGTSVTPVDTFPLPNTNGRGMDFSSDGTVMYLITSTDDLVYQYSLSTAFTLPVIATITADINGFLPNNSFTSEPVIEFTVRFSEDVTGFVEGDITLTGSANGTNPGITNFRTINDALYRFDVHVGSSIGTLMVSIAEGVATSTADSAGNLEAISFASSFTTRDTRPPTVTISSTDVVAGETTISNMVAFNATFSEPIDASTFTTSDITAMGTATHTAINIVKASDIRYTFQIDHSEEDLAIDVSIAAGAFDDPQGNTNTAPSNTYTYDYAALPIIILPTILPQYTVDGQIQLQFRTVNDVTATFNLDGAPSGATITPSGAFTWTPDAAGTFVFNATVTAGGQTDTEPLTFRIANAIDPLVIGELEFDGTLERTANDSPSGMAFSSDGLQLFLVENDASTITQYLTGVPFDFANTTASPNGDIMLGSMTTYVQDSDFTNDSIDLVDIEFSNDGRSMILADEFNSFLEYNLDSPYDTSSPVFVRHHRLPGTVSEASPLGFTISSDGTKLFFVTGLTNVNNRVNECTLPVPFSLEGISCSGTYPLGTNPGAPTDVEFLPGGTGMLVVGDNNQIYEHTLPVPFSLAGMVEYSGKSQTIPNPGVSLRDLALAGNGRHLFMVDEISNDILRFSIPDNTAPTVGITGNVTNGTATESDAVSFTATFSEQIPDMQFETDDISVASTASAGTHTASGLVRTGTEGTTFDFIVSRNGSDGTIMVSIPAGLVEDAGQNGNEASSIYTVMFVASTPPVDPPPTDTAPVLADAATLMAAEDGDVSALPAFTATDPDGTTPTYGISNHPAWLGIDAVTGILQGTVPQDNSPDFRDTDTPARCSDDGSVDFTVLASDDDFDGDSTDDASRNYAITITNTPRAGNAPPVTNATGHVDFAIDADAIDLSGYTTDADMDLLTYGSPSALNSSLFAVNALDSATGILDVTATGAAGFDTLSYTVCDGSDSANLMLNLNATVSGSGPIAPDDDSTIPDEGSDTPRTSGGGGGGGGGGGSRINADVLQSIIRDNRFGDTSGGILPHILALHLTIYDLCGETGKIRAVTSSGYSSTQMNVDIMAGGRITTADDVTSDHISRYVAESGGRMFGVFEAAGIPTDEKTIKVSASIKDTWTYAGQSINVTSCSGYEITPHDLGSAEIIPPTEPYFENTESVAEPACGPGMRGIDGVCEAIPEIEEPIESEPVKPEVDSEPAVKQDTEPTETDSEPETDSNTTAAVEMDPKPESVCDPGMRSIDGTCEPVEEPVDWFTGLMRWLGIA